MKYSQAIAAPIVGALVALGSVGYFSIDFSQPLMLLGDNTQVLNFAKAYADGQGFRYNQFLGFPGTQDNAYFPTFDASFRAILYAAGRLTRNAFLAHHLMYVAGTIGIFLACYVSLRKLSITCWLATTASVAYVATPYFVNRSLVHDFLSLYYSVPFGGTLALLVAKQALFRSHAAPRKDPYVLVGCVVVGTSGLYYAFFSCMFVLIGALCSTVARRRLQPLVTAFCLAAAIFLIMVISGYGSALLDVVRGDAVQVKRLAHEQILYGLNFAESLGALRPYPLFAHAIEEYSRAMPYVTSTKGLFEWPGFFLSGVILASPLISMGVAMSAWRKNSSPEAFVIFQAATFITFGILYAIPGGLAFWFNTFVTPQIRALDRIMPFLTYFALVIVAVAQRQWTLQPSIPKKIVAAISVIALLISAWPSVNGLASKQRAFLNSYGSDLESTKNLLKAKNDLGLSAVLQLPHVPWPEYPAVRQFDPYAHQNNYILDDVGAKTRWSYGSAAAQPAFQAVSSMIETSSAQGLSVAARKLGFDAILVEKRAYSLPEFSSLVTSITRGNQNVCVVFEDAERLLYGINLRPSNRGHCLNWEGPSPKTWRDTLGFGWSTPEGDFVWSDGPESSVEFILASGSIEIGGKLIFSVNPFLWGDLSRRTVEVWQGDHTVATWEFSSPGWTEREVEINSPIRGPILRLLFRQSDVRSPHQVGLNEDSRRLGFALRKIVWQANAK